MENEIWKVYKESYCTRLGHLIYEVSSEGNVKINGKLYDFSEQEGYYAIGHFHVHRAVATLFCDNPENKRCVDHINGNKHDNRAINLRWCTHKENMNNPITKAKISPNMKIAMNRPEVKEKQRAIQKETQNRPEVKKKKSKSLKGRKVWNKGLKGVQKAWNKGGKYMTDGISKPIYVEPEYWGEFIDIGYHFGTN